MDLGGRTVFDRPERERQLDLVPPERPSRG
jgi:hypothetical protein